MKSTPEMRARIRELMTNPQDDYDRAVECVLDDLDVMIASHAHISERIEEAVKAERERCAKIAEPKGPRPCDCEYGACYCRNAGDAAAVASWDADMAVARAIRAPVSGSTEAGK
ncbi:hypothetical protein [Bradyrhizobium sp. 8-10B]|uniref:hypothetical protein n=1 Tax=Bradyrhizobium sp. 8-10B TaxID=3344579 RepID=UPI0035BF2A3C